MSFRFWRRVKIAPGVTLNLSKSGGSLSFGPRGAKFTVGPRGKRATVGIPGTGIFYTTTLPSGRSGGRGKTCLPFRDIIKRMANPPASATVRDDLYPSPLTGIDPPLISYFDFSSIARFVDLQ